jgi:hypothetical protein
MNRREFLECAALLVTGASASSLGWALSEEQKLYLASAPDFVDREVSHFDKSQRPLVAAVAEAIIPRTDTPGAIDAGVPRFIEIMVEQWLTESERAIFMEGLATLQSRARADFGKPFETLESDHQLALLEQMEAEASDSSWYDLGNIRRTFVDDAPFICQVKEFTIWGFFTSEVGGTQVLRYEAMPMRFDGDVPLDPDAGTWMPWLI